MCDLRKRETNGELMKRFCMWTLMQIPHQERAVYLISLEEGVPCESPKEPQVSHVQAYPTPVAGRWLSRTQMFKDPQEISMFSNLGLLLKSFETIANSTKIWTVFSRTKFTQLNVYVCMASWNYGSRASVVYRENVWPGKWDSDLCIMFMLLLESWGNDLPSLRSDFFISRISGNLHMVELLDEKPEKVPHITNVSSLPKNTVVRVRKPLSFPPYSSTLNFVSCC